MNSEFNKFRTEKKILDNKIDKLEADKLNQDLRMKELQVIIDSGAH